MATNPQLAESTDRSFTVLTNLNRQHIARDANSDYDAPRLIAGKSPPTFGTRLPSLPLLVLFPTHLLTPPEKKGRGNRRSRGGPCKLL